MENLILKVYGLEAVRIAQYGAGVSAVISRSKIQSSSNPYSQMAEIQKDPVMYKSALGTPVFCNFEIQEGQWTEDNGTIHEWPFLRFDTVILTVDETKNIVKTTVQGRKGSVKEYISDGDYNVNIKLLIIGSNGVMPLQQISDLKKALDAPNALAVNSRYLQNLGIDNIVVERYAMPQMEGGYNYQQVEIQASSDEPIELFIK
ncbi:MAG: DUF6046 domain-containing protein [Bacteroidota bacterium]